MNNGTRAQELRRELQHDESVALRRRRAIIGLSLVGMGSMAIVSAFQTGLLKHLPDPPLDRFRSDEVNSSDTAYHWGVPDGTISLAGHATNIVLAAYGRRDRALAEPWIPLAACAKAAAEAAVAVRYLFYEMPIVQKKWCGYCITDAVMHIGAFAFTLPEARDAATRVRSELVEARKEIAA
ncbi:vitamin K epoxide reductase family protein [Nitrospira moscoviensis]|uniref:Type I restriction-modification system endonuclease (Modular protein) n=1 Tax=Nitrospira moscoviensis TaxID=42253 RepID=A0A0K2GHV2_NITMO|nr:vitamin K epoxide reductase family protein [Nitrospira moscoviensis]ALA60530.1 Type I restriction-modification system endonuclease (modular protein) [Nitrospira moscoviensis]